MPQDKRAPLAGAVSGQQAPQDSTPLASGPVAGLPVETPVTEEAGRILSVLSSGEIELKGRIPWSSNATFLVSVCGAPPAEGAAEPGEETSWRSTSRPAGSDLSGTSREAYGNAKWLPTSCARSWDGTLCHPPPLAPTARSARGRSSSASTPPPTSTSSLLSTTLSTTARCAASPLSTSSPTMRTAKAATACSTRTGHIWAIDHGLCFHTDPKLRTVIWDFAGEKLDQDLLAPLEMLAGAEVPAHPGEPPQRGGNRSRIGPGKGCPVAPEVPQATG